MTFLVQKVILICSFISFLGMPICLSFQLVSHILARMGCFALILYNLNAERTSFGMEKVARSRNKLQIMKNLELNFNRVFVCVITLIRTMCYEKILKGISRYRCVPSNYPKKYFIFVPLSSNWVNSVFNQCTFNRFFSMKRLICPANLYNF